MTHVATHCGTAGEPTGEKQITIYTGSVLNYAVHLEPEGMKAYGVPEWAIEEFKEFLWCQRIELVKKLIHMGIPYTFHPPHPANLSD